MNIGSTITPKSDQLNSDDLMSGPRTVRITAVKEGSSEQPVWINFEGDNGRPWKPSKSMRRVLVCMWGTDGNSYVGRRITIYRDPLVKFGGEAVGGIKISHASDIAEPVRVSLTETRGKRKPHVVEPLPPEQVAQPLADLPPEWDAWSLEERGTNRASLGTDALGKWWESLSKPDKHALKSQLAEWKTIAANAGKTTA